MENQQLVNYANKSQRGFCAAIRVLADSPVPLTTNQVAEASSLSFTQARSALATATLEGWVSVVEGASGAQWTLSPRLAELGFKQLAAVQASLSVTIEQSKGLIEAASKLASVFGEGGAA